MSGNIAYFQAAKETLQEAKAINENLSDPVVSLLVASLILYYIFIIPLNGLMSTALSISRQFYSHNLHNKAIMKTDLWHMIQKSRQKICSCSNSWPFDFIRANQLSPTSHLLLQIRSACRQWLVIVILMFGSTVSSHYALIFEQCVAHLSRYFSLSVTVHTHSILVDTRYTQLSLFQLLWFIDAELDFRGDDQTALVGRRNNFELS